MTAEANAAVRGVLAAVPEADVTIADAHDVFANLLVEELDPRARLVRGQPRPLWMIEGVQHADAAVFLGYHGRAGSGASVLSHTYSDVVGEVRCNGRPLGELGLNAAVAGAFGVPVVLVAGDDTVAAEAAELLPGARRVEVKRALGWGAADSLHPRRACELIEHETAAAVGDLAGAAALRLDTPVELELEVSHPRLADLAELIPDVTRSSGRCLRYQAPDALTALRIVRLVTALGRAAQ